MNFRIEEGDPEKAGRFDDTRTTYFGRRQRLPVFWVDGERFTLSLANMIRAAQSIEDASSILGVCLDAIEGGDRRGIEGYALALQQKCRQLIRWKDKPKRDVPRRLRRPNVTYL